MSQPPGGAPRERSGGPAHLDAEARARLGAFYTPAEIARRIVEEALDLREGAPPRRVIDPAAGDGAFLLAYAQLARERRLGSEREIATGLFGLDRDPAAPALAAEVLAGQGFVPLPGHLHEGDALLGDWPPGGSRAGPFDLILGNPPFRNIVRLPAEERDALKARFETFHNKCDLYGLFLEASLARLAPGGILAMIVADTFLGTSSFGPLRERIFAAGDVTPRAMWELGAGVFDAAVRCQVLFVEGRPAREEDRLALALLERDGKLRRRGSLPLSPLRARARLSAALPSDLAALERAETMRAHGVPLGELASFSLGVKTGNDARFLAPSAAELPPGEGGRRRLVRALRGRDVQRFRIVGEQVLDYRPELLRTLHGARPRQPEELQRPVKVLVRETSGKRLIAALDDRGRVPLDTLHALWPAEVGRCSNHFLLGVLSARPVEWFYAQHHPGSHVKLGELRELPVPSPDGPWAGPIEQLARRLGGELTAAARSKARRELDDLVASGLGLPGGWRE
ncbi:MAG: N-6 DNA methylase [Deltaproteobacteria bacterium]|nr:N-6 DNA methylase [Deltaproteobacteria bacterium]